MFCVRGPRRRTRRIFVLGSMASQRKTHLFGAAKPGAQFVQLDIRKLEMTEKVLVKALSVFPSTSQPGGDGRLSKAENPFSGGWVHSFGQRSEHHGDLQRGSFQPVEGRVAPGSEGGVAGLASKCLDLLSTTLFAISDERVNVSFGYAEVGALSVGTGVALGVHSLGCSSAAFHLTPGADKRRSRFHTWRRSAGETAGRAVKWSAWFEQTVDQRASPCCLRMAWLKMEPVKTPKQRQQEEESDHEQEHKHEHMKGHTKPRRLKWGAWSSCSSKHKASLLYCQTIKRVIRIIHHRKSLYPLLRPGRQPASEGGKATVQLSFLLDTLLLGMKHDAPHCFM